MSDFENAIHEAKRLSATPEGQQLAKLLLQLGGNDLQHTLDAMAAGDVDTARKTLSLLMANPEAKQLLNQLGELYGK